MTELESEAMEAEFDTVAGWTEEAVRALGPGVRRPGGLPGERERGCAALARRPAGARPGTRMLDSGAGVGGPAGWLAAERGVRPVCAEPMAAAVRACHRLFGLPVGRRAGAAAPVRRRHLRRGLVPRASCAPRRTSRARWPSCAGCCARAAGWACWSSSPTGRCPRRCPRATSSRRRRSCSAFCTRPASPLEESTDADLGRQPGRVDRARRRRRRRGRAQARRRPRLPAGAGERPAGGPAAVRGRARGLAGGRLTAARGPRRTSSLVAALEHSSNQPVCCATTLDDGRVVEVGPPVVESYATAWLRGSPADSAVRVVGVAIGACRG